jgi:hypothetical protein
MLFLQNTPLETTNYMIAGYAVIFTFIAIYLISLYVRNRNLKQDIQILEEIEQNENRKEIQQQIQADERG